MRRAARIALMSLTLLGLWNQLWQVMLGLSPGHHHVTVPECGGGANPDGCSPGGPH